MQRFLLFIIALVIIATNSLPAQGLYWETATTGAMFGEKSMLGQCSYMPLKFRQTSSEKGITVILRLDTKMMYSLNDQKKTYWEISLDKLEGMMKKTGSAVNEKMAEMKKNLESLPPDQRKMVEQMMGDKLGGNGSELPIDVATTGEKKTVSGYACEENTIRQGDRLLFTVWTTKSVSGFESMRKELREFGEKLASMNPINGTAMAAGMKRLEGFPIMTVFPQPEITTTVTKVEQKSTPASAFEIPKGYAKVEPEILQHNK